MELKRKAVIAILLIGIIFVGAAVWLYYQQETSDSKTKQTASTATTESDAIIENPQITTDKVADSTKVSSDTDNESQETATTAEKKQNKKLPDNYEWDEKRWGEPPQIVYDFAENQEKFDFIVSEVDSLLSEGEGFTTRRNNDKLYSESESGEQLKKDIEYLLDNTKFYLFTKYKGGNWVMEYNQEEYKDRYTYTMEYAPQMTEEKAWDEGYIKVVGDWYFVIIWMI